MSGRRVGGWKGMIRIGKGWEEMLVVEKV